MGKRRGGRPRLKERNKAILERMEAMVGDGATIEARGRGRG